MDTKARFCPSCGSGVVAAGGRISDTTPIPQLPVARPVTTVVKPKASKMLEQLREATLGDYEILAELGMGGMATVFLAHDLQLDRRVAIKLMHPALVAGEGMVDRFILEARTAAGLSHHNIIPIYAVKVEEDLLFFVMKFVEGRPLDSIISKEAPLPSDMVRHIVSQVAEALGYAHKRGVIHRDIKPANIMISTDGHPVLTDFGIAKVADKKGLTMTGATIGTPTYMSPEQCNALPLTGASDQYSLGVMAYEMLTGKPPFDADSVMTIMFKHINEPLRPVLERVHDCPPDLAAAIDRMLAKAPEDRFATLEEVAQAINRPTITGENKVRTQLVQYALAGSNRDVLKRVSTPRSPIPSTLVKKPKTRVAAAGAGEKRSLSRPVLWGGLGILAIAGVALAVSRPWQKAQEPVISSVTVDSLANQVQVPLPPPPQVQDTQPDSIPAAVAETPRQQAAAPRPAPRTNPPASAPTSQVSAVNVSGLTTLTVGGISALLAEARDAQGRLMSGRTVGWQSSAPGIVSVNSAGHIAARSPGRATVTATVDGIAHAVTITVNPEPVAAQPPSVIRESTPTAPPVPAGPTEAELRAQVASTIQAYANALESGNIARVRQMYPGMPAGREQQLRVALPEMRDLRIQLTIGQIDLNGDNATAQVTGRWVFNQSGQRTVLPADNTYILERRGAGWVITEIR
jgi:serine/threonine protein kinase